MYGSSVRCSRRMCYLGSGCNTALFVQIKAEGTEVEISSQYENQYSVNIPFTVSCLSELRSYSLTITDIGILELAFKHVAI